MKANQPFICLRCQDLIRKEKCFICEKDNNLCKKCLDDIIFEFFNQPSFIQIEFNQINLEWIKMIKSDFFICKGCVYIGLYLVPEIDVVSNWEISSIPFRIYLLLKRSKKEKG